MSTRCLSIVSLASLCSIALVRSAPAQGSGCEPRWRPTFGSGAETNGAVQDLVVFDEGNGPALYAGGGFTKVGGVTAAKVARWNGASWSAVGSGVTGIDSPHVAALAVFDNGTGPALYAAGRFDTAGGVSAEGIAKWDGASWSALGNGIPSEPVGFGSTSVFTLAVFDDGGGPALYAAGNFNMAGSVTANGIAKWNGSSWSALAGGMTDPFYRSVDALAEFDDGSGPALYAGGSFDTAGGVVVNYIAKWNGTNWSALGGGMDGSVSTLIVHDDGSGPALYAAGTFTTAGGVPADSIAKWDGTNWSAIGTGVAASSVFVFDDGSGPALFACALGEVMKWDGTSWSPVGWNVWGEALALYDDGSGPVPYSVAVSGYASESRAAGRVVVTWNGSRWAPLHHDNGVNGEVTGLCVHDDGSGPALYATGAFTRAGDVLGQGIVKWDGSSWATLGNGVFSHGGVWIFTFGARALASYDDGSGPALYAGGGFTIAGGVAASKIAKWDGTSWSALGAGTSAGVQALAVYDDGSGPALFAGGLFTQAGGMSARRIAKWDGSAWTPLGSGLTAPSQPRVDALAVHDDGSGPALFAAGYFGTAGGVAANRIARWDGSTWSALGVGTFGNGNNLGVAALAVYDDGLGAQLLVGGPFTETFDSGDWYLARWGCRLAHSKVRRR